MSDYNISYPPSTSDDDNVPTNKKRKRIRKSALEWTMEMSQSLIQQVQKFDNIWDSNNKLYKNREMNNNSWESISKALGIPKNEVVLRWNSLRGNYQTHVKKTRETKVGQTGRNKKQTNPLFLQLKFLDPVLNTVSKMSDSNVMPTSSSEAKIELDLSESELEEESVNLSTPIRRSRQSLKNPNTLQKTLMISNAHEMRVKGQSTDEWDAFGNLITSNARTWAQENLGFARRYKAALSAVNAQFEMEAAEFTSTSLEYVETDDDVKTEWK